MTDLRRLTAADRHEFSATRAAARRCQKLIGTGAIQCDTCENAAQTAAFSAGCVDAICYACFPTFHQNSVAQARAAAAQMLAPYGL